VGGAAALVIALAMRLMVSLTDINTWKNFLKECMGDGRLVVWNLINWIANRNAGLYSSVRQYIMKCNSAMNRKSKAAIQTDESFIVTASAITMVLRPFRTMQLDLCEGVFSISNQTNCLESYDAGVKSAAEQFCVYILTIPHLTQRLPAALLPALQHSSTFSPCLRTMVVRNF
jgi:ubiquitin-protein ligase E3 B